MINNFDCSPSFGSHHWIVKDLFNAGRLPRVKFGLYGERLKRGQVSVEHLIPKSKGGTDTFSNYALASAQINRQRGDEDLALSPKKIRLYLSQFRIKIPGIFDGFRYIEDLTKTFQRMGLLPRPKKAVPKTRRHKAN